MDALQNAAKLNPLPEYQWTLAEALRAAGRENEASGIEAQLRKHGASSDPRTLALFLATRHDDLRRRPFDLRERNLIRAVMSSLTTPWRGRWLRQATSPKRMAKCNAHWQKAPKMRGSFSMLRVIASQTGHAADAERWLRKASELSHLLLPSERNELQNAAACGAERRRPLPRIHKKPFSLGPNTARKTQPKPQPNLKNK